jgi:hypothetical protein
MSKETDIEYQLARLEAQHIKERQIFAERQREAKREREMSKRQQLKQEIAAVRWRA